MSKPDVKKKVYFLGAGPGDPELLTLKAKRLLEEADVVLYYGYSVSPEILRIAKGELINTYGMSLEEFVRIVLKEIEEGKLVVRLHSGDPSLFGGMLEQVYALKEYGVEAEVIPGVSSVFAASAALKTQLTLPGVAQTLIITRPGEEVLKKALKGVTYAILMGVEEIREILKNFDDDIPVAVVYHVTWKDEKILMGNAREVMEKVERDKIKQGAVILIGDVIKPNYIKRLSRGEQ
ncbi:MAG: cobalt-precorrin-4/precorrin-4 C(11)-methyltransferase [Candidatus Methanospirareceae archaeon]